MVDSKLIKSVSVLMITYNHEKFISKAIEGVLMQKTTFQIELIIGEDCSTDNTRNICQEYKKKYPETITLLLPDTNLGMNLNFIEALQAAKGKYIALCEGDDYWTDPLKLQKQIDILENPDYENIIAVVTNTSVCDLNGNIIKNDKIVIPPSNVDGIYTLQDFFKDNHQYPTLTVVFRNKNLNFLIENMKAMSNSFLGDWILWILLYFQGSFYFFNQVTASYRTNPNSITHTTNSIKRWEADFVIRKKLLEILPPIYHKYISNNWNGYFQLSMAYRKNKQYNYFLYFQLCSLFNNPILYLKYIFNILKSKNENI